MSLYRSEIGEIWSLQAAVDALGAAARRAGKPGWLWIAGHAYPVFLVYGWELALPLLEVETSSGPLTSSSIPSFLGVLGPAFERQEAIALALLVLAISLPFYRLAAGLARLSPPDVWERNSRGGGRPPRLRTAWRAGKGLTLSFLGLQIQVAIMFVLAIVLTVGPLYLVLDRIGLHDGILPAALASPFVVVLALYGAVLSALLQLALHSLTRNGRGVASAMLHAWRLMRRDPWATARTMAVDGVLVVATLSVMALLGIFEESCFGFLLLLPLLAARAYAGVTRSCYWSAAYRALGGLSPDDGVPGLVAEPR